MAEILERVWGGERHAGQPTPEKCPLARQYGDRMSMSLLYVTAMIYVIVEALARLRKLLLRIWDSGTFYRMYLFETILRFRMNTFAFSRD